jgi:hypothetical protein
MTKALRQAALWFVSAFKALVGWPISIQRPWLFWCGIVLLVVGVPVALQVNLQQLKDWQTLSAALVALGAATVAYRAAMAKVTLDRELSDRELLRRKVGLYLRLEFALTLLKAEAFSIERRTRVGSHAPQCIDLKVTDAPEIDEAWTHIEFFPRPLIKELHRVRLALRFLRNTIREEGVTVLDRRTCEALNEYATRAVRACETIIELIRRDMHRITEKRALLNLEP